MEAGDLRWIVVRYIGLAIVAALACLFVSRLAGADESKAPVKAQVSHTPRETTTTVEIHGPPRHSTPTPPLFPFGPRGGSYAPAGASPSGAVPSTGFIWHR